jgi:hypothetical protein
MISMSDVDARLRLFRYGLIVLVVTTFLVSLFAPWAYLNGLGSARPAITAFLGTAVMITGVVAVITVVVYFVYRAVLQRTVGGK